MKSQDNSGAAASLPEAFAADCKMAGPWELRATHRATNATQVFTVKNPYAFIGRAPQMSVRLDDPSVSQFHAYLQIVEGLPHLIDMGSRSGIEWPSGNRPRGFVQSGQSLRFGAFNIQFTDLGAAGISRAARDEEPETDPCQEEFLPPLVLEIHGSAARQAEHQPVAQAVTLIGRHPRCDIRFFDDSLAYFQCAVVNTMDGAWCLDLLSRKGTVLNGRTARLSRLRDGDLLE